jgi:predicted RNA binding protein YcfA (HicA-like mRNA interferase family)
LVGRIEGFFSVEDGAKWSVGKVARLPTVSGQKAASAFASFGYVIVRQRGSHLRLRDSSGQRQPLTIPDHRELKSGLLRRLIRDAGLTVAEFVDAL